MTPSSISTGLNTFYGVKIPELPIDRRKARKREHLHHPYDLFAPLLVQLHGEHQQIAENIPKHHLDLIRNTGPTPAEIHNLCNTKIHKRRKMAKPFHIVAK